MAGYEGMTRIEPESPVYQEVTRLYRIAQEMHPGGLDRWNGELYSRTDDKYGGLTRDGTMRLNEQLVLDQLTGGEGTDDPRRQGHALATVLHESLHARVELDAKNEPNALRAPRSLGLDEGLTELATMEDYNEFVRRAGYQNAQKPDPEYPGAVHAASELLDRASSSAANRTELLNDAIDQPVMMRWDTIADKIVKNELADTVRPDAEHQQAARAHLVNQMAVGDWEVVADFDGLGPATAELTTEAIDNAVAQLREHYQNTPDEPYPARTPNPAAEVVGEPIQQNEQQRAVTQLDHDQPLDLADLPPPDATTRIPDQAQPNPATPEPAQDTPSTAEPAQASPHNTEPAQPAPASAETTQPSSPDRTDDRRQSPANAQPAARGQQGDPMRFLNNQAPAAHATRPGPALGDGARGAGSPAGPSASRPDPARTSTPERGGRG